LNLLCVVCYFWYNFFKIS